MIPSILKWALEEQPIRAILLVGSRAVNKKVDALSDYDLSIFCETHQPYTQDDHWLSKIGKVWVCVHEQVCCNQQDFPVRLVIFEGGVKVDFAFYSLDYLQSLCKSLPEEYQGGYSVLLDKDDAAAHLASPKGLQAQKPKREEFHRVVNEFWFEAYHVAKYLKRGDLWSVKFRSTGLQNFLLTMIEWNTLAKREWREPLPDNGKHMRSWVEDKTWTALHQIFAHFDGQDSWSALRHTLSLFRDLALETAQQLAYPYPHEVDQHISKFILSMQRGTD